MEQGFGDELSAVTVSYTHLMERLAADFSANPEEILPEPGTLETGRAYREKKAKPLLAQYPLPFVPRCLLPQ